jgi:hypothetical protein
VSAEKTLHIWSKKCPVLSIIIGKETGVLLIAYFEGIIFLEKNKVVLKSAFTGKIFEPEFWAPFLSETLLREWERWRMSFRTWEAHL